MKESLSFPLGDVPFYWRMLDDFGADRKGIPDLLPFSFSFRPELQLITQFENSAVLDWLRRVYREDANVGYLQEGHALSVPYGDEFLRFVDEVLDRHQLSPKSAMEIGCGGVYLLKRLRDRGFAVCGIDPSPVSSQQARNAGLELIADFYPSPGLSRRADLLFHHNVLEHVADPVEFLRAHHANLNPGGQVIVAVPDCSEAIERGDVSMMLHEHLVYFDEASLANTFIAAGFEVLDVGRSRFGGVLFGAARMPSVASAVTPLPENPGTAKFDRFRKLADRAIQNFSSWMESHRAAGRSVGFYVPLRAIPYLAACGHLSGYRFFDDDPGIHSKYFAGIRVQVEDFKDLSANPVDHLLVASLAFGEKIATKVKNRFEDNVRTSVLRDILPPDT